MNQANQNLLHPSRQVGADLAAWRKVGGGEGLLAALADPQSIVSKLQDANLCGMGGAGFPTWRKWEAAVAAQSKNGDKYVVCNANEDEPGTFKDRVLLAKKPHQVIEGVLIAAVAVVVFGVAQWKEVARNTDWGVLMLFGGGISLSALLQSSGASEALGQQVASTFSHSPALLVIFVVAAFIIFLTEFTSNTASAALLVPIFASIAAQMGLPEQVLVFVIGIGASCAFMLPVATPPNAIVFGTGLIKQREMMNVGLLLNVLCIVLVALWAYFVLMP